MTIVQAKVLTVSQINDLTFRRHILVQALIILNFILSWTADAKKKYKTIQPANKAVSYTGEFSEEDVSSCSFLPFDASLAKQT